MGGRVLNKIRIIFIQVVLLVVFTGPVQSAIITKFWNIGGDLVYDIKEEKFAPEFKIRYFYGEGLGGFNFDFSYRHWFLKNGSMEHDPTVAIGMYLMGINFALGYSLSEEAFFRLGLRPEIFYFSREGNKWKSWWPFPLFYAEKPFNNSSVIVGAGVLWRF